jgi:serine/threonine protein kinase
MDERRGNKFKDEWAEICRQFLPITSDDKRWKFSRTLRPDDPEQGWKLHLSATILTARDVLLQVAPLLSAHGVIFKAPATFEELNKINSGIDYGYSQVGKVFTVYPRSSEEAVLLAHRLHDLTCGLPAPTVPFDRQFRPGSCLYYRYGGFTPLEIRSPDGANVPALRTPEGHLISDSRVSWESELSWLSDPFQEEPPQFKPVLPDSPLKTTFRVFRALTQRGRGGVYQAIDLRAHPPRLCILKEGRRNGETGLDGRDGSHRVRHEAQVLSHLHASGIEAPNVFSSFEVGGNYYLAMEFIPGESLHSLLSKRQRRLGIAQALRYGIQISEIVARLHVTGWAWRDCKPGNLMMTRNGIFRPIDFESACPCNQPDPLPWRTPDFTPPESAHGAPGGASDDLYAIGAILYLLLTGRTPVASGSIPATKWRSNLPSEILSVISDLLAPEPQQRPAAAVIARNLMAFLSADRNLSG